MVHGLLAFGTMTGGGARRQEDPGTQPFPERVRERGGIQIRRGIEPAICPMRPTKSRTADSCAWALASRPA